MEANVTWPDAIAKKHQGATNREPVTRRNLPNEGQVYALAALEHTELAFAFYGFQLHCTWPDRPCFALSRLTRYYTVILAQVCLSPNVFMTFKSPIKSKVLKYGLFQECSHDVGVNFFPKSHMQCIVVSTLHPVCFKWELYIEKQEYVYFVSNSRKKTHKVKWPRGAKVKTSSAPRPSIVIGARFQLCQTPYYQSAKLFFVPKEGLLKAARVERLCQQHACWSLWPQLRAHSLHRRKSAGGSISDALNQLTAPAEHSNAPKGRIKPFTMRSAEGGNNDADYVICTSRLSNPIETLLGA